MNWLTPALLAPILYTIVVLVDKYIVEKQLQHIWGLPLYTTSLGLIFGTGFWLASDRIWLSSRDGTLILLAGAFTIWGGILYFKAMSQETSSVIVVLFQMQPIMVLLLSWLLLGEWITPRQLLGFFLILITAILLSLQPVAAALRQLRLSPAFFWILVADAMWAIAAILFKFVIQTDAFLVGAAYESWGIFLGGLLAAICFPQMRRDFRASLRSGSRLLGIISLSESLFVIAKFIQLLAITLGPVALVVVLGSAQIFFTLIIASILTLLAPHIFKENLAPRHLATRAFWSALMVLGIWLVG